jgi:N-methylhydantoinase A
VPRAQRRVVTDAGRPRRAPVFRRDDLPVGWRARGPLVVCEYSATTVVPPAWSVSVERTGGLVLEAPDG